MPKMLALEFNFGIFAKFIVTKFNTLLRFVYNSQLTERFNITFLMLQLPVMKISVPKKQHFSYKPILHSILILNLFSFFNFSQNL